MPRSRDLDWDGLLNARDLGGHPTEDGAETRWGSVVRADSVRQLTDGWQAVVDYGVRTIVDLRSDEELAEDPPAERSRPCTSFFDSRPEVFEEVEQAPRPPPTTRRRRARSTSSSWSTFGRTSPPRSGGCERTRGGVVALPRRQDRTGLVSAFLLRLAGVPIEEIATDYSLSEERLRTRHEEWFAQAADEAELERLHGISKTPAPPWCRCSRVERRYGGIAGYLKAGGAMDEELERARPASVTEPRVLAVFGPTASGSRRRGNRRPHPRT